MRRSVAACIIPCILLVSCVNQREKYDVEEDLLQADRDFAAETADRGADGWADRFALDGVMLTEAGAVEGRDSIRAHMSVALAPGGPRLTWEPLSADVGSAGDLGYTTGRWTSILTLPDGRDSTLATGNYVTIWKMVPDEGWRIVLDIGNEDLR